MRWSLITFLSILIGRLSFKRTGAPTFKVDPHNWNLAGKKHLNLAPFSEPMALQTLILRHEIHSEMSLAEKIDESGEIDKKKGPNLLV